MKASIEITRKPANSSAQYGGLGGSSQQIPAAPTIDSIIEAICSDATKDSLRFLLRSDTGHDGE